MCLSPLASCIFLIGYVLDSIATDGRDMFFSSNWILDCVLLSFVQGRFKRYSRDASATGKNIPNLCPKGFDEILQVLYLENRTKAASRA